MSFQILDFKRRFQRGIGSSPFEAVPVAGLPFTQYGLEWCNACQMEVDADTQAANQGTLYLWKRLCKRCGVVLKRGIYDAGKTPFPKVAFDWLTEAGKNRS